MPLWHFIQRSYPPQSPDIPCAFDRELFYNNRRMCQGFTPILNPTFGVPSVITSDNGAQFTSSIWINLCRFLGIKHSPWKYFHPQSNGLVERFHCCLKVSLIAWLSGQDSFNHLPLVLLGLQSVPREDSAISASEALLVLCWFCP